MSCIVGIFNTDGAPVDPELLQSMAEAMKSRAPDAIETWRMGNVGFGHAMLRIAPESEHEHQPLTLDQRVWITADARIDGQAELRDRLRSAGRTVASDAPDVELILHAYGVFGEAFLDFLIGDFAFALWDEPRRKLICVRDHFGVRPFFYARRAKSFLFGSDINALLKHSAVTREIDEVAVGDFLLFGNYLDAELSIYVDIRRLPAACCLILSEDKFKIKKYWRINHQGEIQAKKAGDAVEQFKGFFEQAVIDRVRTDNIALELSGGMDSTAIAAMAVKDMRTRGGIVTAYTNTCNSLLPQDQESYYAGLVASRLGIQTSCRDVGLYSLFERHGSPELATAEPVASGDLAFLYDRGNEVRCSGARVLLAGQMGDAVFEGASTYYRDLLRSGQPIRFLYELYRHWLHTGTVRGAGLRNLISSVTMPLRYPVPDWLASGFVRRLGLEERWQMVWQLYDKSDTLDQLQRPWMGFGSLGYEALSLPLVGRFPFMDIRLIGFMLNLPSYLKYNKFVMRKSMCSNLPQSVIDRPKEGVLGDLIWEKLRRKMVSVEKNKFNRVAAADYIDINKYLIAVDRYRNGNGGYSSFEGYFLSHPVALSYWLESNVNHGI